MDGVGSCHGSVVARQKKAFKDVQKQHFEAITHKRSLCSSHPCLPCHSTGRSGIDALFIQTRHTWQDSTHKRRADDLPQPSSFLLSTEFRCDKFVFFFFSWYL